MKKLIILFSITLLLFSCGKKEVKKETQEITPPVPKDTIVKEKMVKEEVPSLVFTVQIAALKNPNNVLANLNGVHIYEENSLTKYRLGAFETYEAARSKRNELRSKYKGAFVQALENNRPIHIKEALKINKKN
ncbi:SPOR domain-containing protein [Polaribacter batillariae]|uniref:SPOR domain-containing protein n=1 Tax=Polaribacter batillariae TaxID=2808900 RepID=A0ABX7ST09_9FLAO|nr:SPOR domain-containing protein [Polaribacter batillariae]QTD37382.1 SPOR domain-containing protein [Polaribacter batillariae]